MTRSYNFDRVNVSKPKTAGFNAFDAGTYRFSVGDNLNNPMRLVARPGLGHTSVTSGLNRRTLDETVM